MWLPRPAVSVPPRSLSSSPEPHPATILPEVKIVTAKVAKVKLAKIKIVIVDGDKLKLAKAEIS